MTTQMKLGDVKRREDVVYNFEDMEPRYYGPYVKLKEK